MVAVGFVCDDRAGAYSACVALTWWIFCKLVACCCIWLVCIGMAFVVCFIVVVLMLWGCGMVVSSDG